ncbi:hypothetical protein GJ698_26050 [Pseudoduganella sp. FT26W]|uniref:Uncharacterized protein n=1 Tax=Duganella aquatilis TaxID=2666082 RepID=A0A844DGQ9_9BURK|nr:hypothetical protein [Duganella aquatilis]MRW87539.1 hypothetical protein [Duganella aquatilis]
MKHYNTPYTARDDAERCWHPELLVGVDACHSATGRSVTYNLERGQVAIVFDLGVTLKGGRSAIRSMLANARLDLYTELEKFERSVLKPGSSRPKIKKPRLNKLLLRLRMCDAMWKKATDDELLRVLYPGYYLKGNSPTPDERAQLVRKIRDDQRAAIQLMESGYLELVPLDYFSEEPLQSK